jgi:D-alanyl-D-alanine carboxypeptidase
VIKRHHILIQIACLLVISLGLTVSIQAQDEQEILDSVVSDYAAEDGAALVVQVTTPDGTWVSAGGLADEERSTTSTDRFRIGSMSKTYVAAVALMLVEQGVFNLDDAASDWLPQDIIDNIANVDTVTIRQLLAMRSGIDDYLATDEFWDAALADPTYEWTPAEALTYAYGLEPLFAPDEAYSYSNSNYLLMQMILEEASGMPLHELMRTKILDPLKLKNTYTQGAESMDGGFVYGYEDMDEDGTQEEVSGINDGVGLADGGLISTTADVTAFYKALLQDQTLLSEDSMQELLAFQDDEEGGGYSLGLGNWESDYGEAIGHSGAVSGFVSEGFYLPEYEAIVVVLSANAETDPDEIAFAAVEALLGEDE